MPDWRYVSKWENPKATIEAINKEHGRITSSPVFFGYWAKVSLYRVTLKDWEVGLHSLITENTCSCSLQLSKSSNPLVIIGSKQHRNHKTLEPESKPKIRRLVGTKISWSPMGTEDRYHLDNLWDPIIRMSNVKGPR